MRVFCFITIVVGALLQLQPQQPPNDYLMVTRKEYTVYATTSIGGFECKYDLTTKDTLFFNESRRVTKLAHSIPVKEFGCGNFMLNSDFRKTLKEKEFPKVKIELTNFKKQGEILYCDLNLNLVGKLKQYKNLKLKKDKKRVYGDVFLNFSDFGLKPPNKAGGLIKIEEQIKIEVSLEIS